MSIRDALHIAWTKYKSRRIIGALTAGVGSVMLLILLLLSLTTTGVGNSINSIPGLGGRYILFDYGTFDFNFEPPTEDQEKEAQDYVFSEQEIREELETDDVKISQIHRHINLPSYFTIGDRLLIDGKSVEDLSSAFAFTPSSFAVRSQTLLQERLGEGQDLSIGEDGSIPVFINSRILVQLEDINFDTLQITEKARELDRITNDYMGRVLTLADSEGQQEIKIRIVGIAPNDAISEQTSTSFFALETLGERERFEINELFSIVGVEEDAEFAFFGFGGEYVIEEGERVDFFALESASTNVYEFENAKDLKAFRNEYRCDGFVPDENCREMRIIGNATLEYEDIIDDIWKGMRYVVGFFATLTGIFILIITWKIMSESRKETGVFRAMGASRFDIAKIYLGYTAIISSMSFVMATIGAIALALLMNRQFADELTTQLANFTGAFGAEISVSFIGIKPLHLVGIWAFAVVVGFIGGAIPIWYNTSSSPIKAIRSE